MAKQVILMVSNKTLLLALLPIIVLITAPSAVAKHGHHSDSQSCDNSEGTCGQSSSDIYYQNGLDQGTRNAENAIQSGACQVGDSPCFSDYSISDCSNSVGSNVGNPTAYCQGFLKGYYDAAGLPQFDQSGR